jgi:hypothetical protein
MSMRRHLVALVLAACGDSHEETESPEPNKIVREVKCKNDREPGIGCWIAMYEFLHVRHARVVDIDATYSAADKLLVVETSDDGPWPRGRDISVTLDTEPATCRLSDCLPQPVKLDGQWRVRFTSAGETFELVLRAWPETTGKPR